MLVDEDTTESSDQTRLERVPSFRGLPMAQAMTLQLRGEGCGGAVDSAVTFHAADLGSNPGRFPEQESF